MIQDKREVVYSATSIARDFLSGIIVFLVALPLCLGIAVASGAPPVSGLIAGIIGGILVGIFSGSHTSVSGPAAGLTAIVAAQIAGLGSFQAFLMAVVIGGILQVLMGLFKAGALSAFFPSSVIKGLLAAIGVILILKQFPHLFGHDKDPIGDMAFEQKDHKNTFTEFGEAILEVLSKDVQTGALTIGILSLVLLIVWDQIKPLKKSLVPAPLLVVIMGVLLGRFFAGWGGSWQINPDHMVQVPVASSFKELASFIQLPDFSQLTGTAVYIAGITVAVVASLETLLNLDAVDKLDRKQRISPPNRELFAQGIGNILSGMTGGMPMTSVVIRGSVNVNAGAETRLSAIFHGVLLLVCVVLLPNLLNMIPLSCLAALLLLTGYKLASPKLFKQMWSEGRYQFLPFILTLIAIVMTDLLIGILIGLAISLVFVLNSNLRRPIRRIYEKHIEGDVLHIELANQVSFLNRAALESAFREVPRGGRILLDARRTDYIDPDILSLIREFRDITAPVFEIRLAMVGFRDKYKLKDSVESVDFAPQEERSQLTPAAVVEILTAGNRRFHEGHPLDRDLRRLGDSNEPEHSPIAAIVTGIDPRTPVEMIFDLGPGDAYVLRTPGNVVGENVVGGLEFAAADDGVKLIVVMGHADSRLLTVAIENMLRPNPSGSMAGLQSLQPVVEDLSLSIEREKIKDIRNLTPTSQIELRKSIVRRHTLHSVQRLLDLSPSLRQMTESGQVGIVGALFDVQTGQVEFLPSGNSRLPGSVVTPQ